MFLLLKVAHRVKRLDTSIVENVTEYYFFVIYHILPVSNLWQHNLYICHAN